MNSRNYREQQRVKSTDTLSPKGTVAGNVRVGAPTSRTIKLPVERGLLSSVQCLQGETWKTCKSPGNRKTNRKAVLMGLQVEEVVKSKGLSVMERIQRYLWRENEPTYHRSFIARESVEPFKGKRK